MSALPKLAPEAPDPQVACPGVTLEDGFHPCGVTENLIFIGHEHPLMCRACFCKWDIEDEAKMFACMAGGKL